MKRAEIARKTPMKRTPFKVKPDGRPKSLKTKQRAVTAEEKVLWDRLASLGCIACLKDGVYNTHVSIHHIDGRTKEGCHKLVLPLCASHHQDGSGPDPTRIAVHPWKARFEKMYGSQMSLLEECLFLLDREKAA